MIRPIVYIIFALLLAFAILIATIMACLCKKWSKAYYTLRKKYNQMYKENIKLQHDLYRKTYIIPSTNNKEGEKKNGTK